MRHLSIRCNKARDPNLCMAQPAHIRLLNCNTDSTMGPVLCWDDRAALCCPRKECSLFITNNKVLGSQLAIMCSGLCPVSELG